MRSFWYQFWAGQDPFVEFLAACFAMVSNKLSSGTGFNFDEDKFAEKDGKKEF